MKSGYITLLGVLVVGVVGISLSVSILLLGLGSSRTGFAVEQSYQVKALASACIEEALQRINDSTPFAGSNTLTIGQGTCTYTVTSQGGQNRTIAVSAVVGTMVRKVKIILDNINPAIRIVSWQEVDNL